MADEISYGPYVDLPEVGAEHDAASEIPTTPEAREREQQLLQKQSTLVSHLVEQNIKSLTDAINEPNLATQRRGDPQKFFEILAEVKATDKSSGMNVLDGIIRKMPILDLINANEEMAKVDKHKLKNAFTKLEILKTGALLAQGNGIKASMIHNLLSNDYSTGEISKENAQDIIDELLNGNTFEGVDKEYDLKFAPRDLLQDLIKVMGMEFTNKIAGEYASYQKPLVPIAQQKRVAEDTMVDEERKVLASGGTSTRGGGRENGAAKQLSWVKSPELLSHLTRHPEDVSLFQNGMKVGVPTYYKTSQAQNTHFRQLLDSRVIRFHDDDRMSDQIRASHVPTWKSEYSKMNSPYVSQQAYTAFMQEKRVERNKVIAELSVEGKYKKHEAELAAAKKQNARGLVKAIAESLAADPTNAASFALSKNDLNNIRILEERGEMHIDSGPEQAYKSQGWEYQQTRVDSSRYIPTGQEVAQMRADYAVDGMSALRPGQEKEFFAQLYYQLNGENAERVMRINGNRGIGSNYGRIFTDNYQKGFILELERLQDINDVGGVAELKKFINGVTWPHRLGFTAQEVEKMFDKEQDFVPGESTAALAYLDAQQKFYVRMVGNYIKDGINDRFIERYIEKERKLGVATEETVQEMQKVLNESRSRRQEVASYTPNYQAVASTIWTEFQNLSPEPSLNEKGLQELQKRIADLNPTEKRFLKSQFKLADSRLNRSGENGKHLSDSQMMAYERFRSALDTPSYGESLLS